jgi:hypothetical protein
MLIASLVFSCVFLLLVNLTAFRSGSILPALPWCALPLAGYFLMPLLLPFMLQAAMTLAAGLVCARLAPRPRVFLATTIGAFVLAYAIIGVPIWIEFESWKRQNGPTSVADRLDYEAHPLRLPESPTVGADVRLVSFRTSSESPFDEKGDLAQAPRAGRDMRARALQRLHDEQVSVFVNSPGFGVMRGSRPLSRWLGLPEEAPVPFEYPESVVPPESRALEGGAASLDDAMSSQIEGLHRSSASDFAYPAGFGYVKERTQVFGFRPHRFSAPPQPIDSWRFRNVELVSLLKHGKPAVYVSDNLPRMSELRHAATRTLDAFEAAALPRLAKDDLVVHATGERLRVLGSIRAGEACLACHAGKEGGLLGAFSYTLDRPARE